MRRLRRDAGLSLKQLADRCHFSLGHISNVEHGLKPPTLGFVSACDSALGTEGVLERLLRSQRPTEHRGGRGPGQLPPISLHFSGRSDALALLDQLFGETNAEPGGRVVAIDGMAGVGKTTLAVRWARDIRDRFPDGVLFSDLQGYSPDAAPTSAEDVLEDFLRALGVAPADIPARVDQRSALLRTRLDGTRTLLVLDNAANSEQVRPLLPGTPGCLVVVTSRTRLSGLVVREGAHRIALDPFASAESTDLLLKVVGPERVGAEPDAADELVVLCSGVPLAICVAGERIAAHPDRNLAEFVAELAAEGRRLDVLAAGDDSSLTIRAVFSWSYRALDADAATLFRHLGLHSGCTISAPCAAAAAGIVETAARTLLDRLHLAHLVESAGHDCYRLHDLLRVYAIDLGRTTDSADQRREASRRLVRWYLHTANAAVNMITPRRPHLTFDTPPDRARPLTFTSYAEALAWCVDELSNFPAISRLASALGLHDEAWQLAVTLFDYFLVRNPWTAWISTHTTGVESAFRVSDSIGQGWTLIGLGEAYRRSGDLKRAQDCFDRAMPICRTHDGPLGHVWVLAGLAFLDLARDRADTAAERLAEMAALCRERDFVFGEATALANLGDAQRLLGDLDQALDHAQKALHLYESLDDVAGQAYALLRVGRVRFARHENDAARASFARSVALHRQIGHTWDATETMIEYGRLLIDAGDTARAVECWQSALTDLDVIDKPKAADLRRRIRAVT